MQAEVPDLKSMPPIRGTYQMYHAMQLASRPFNLVSGMAGQFYDLPMVRAALPGFAGNMRGTMGVLEYMTNTREKPRFNIPGLAEEIVPGMSTPFVDLVHFKQSNIDQSLPKVLLVAPMSGHFATLLRDTVRVIAQTRDVYITDWKCASQVPLNAGDFDVDDYTNTLKKMIRYFEGHVHVKAVCQPSVQLAMAVAHMHMHKDPHVPKSMSMAGGPIDTRINPGQVNLFAQRNDPESFNRLIDVVPLGLPGAGREVYPGFMQLNAFMAMNKDRHVRANVKYYNALAEGDVKTAKAHEAFYDEYLAVLDMTADFYLRTIKSIFHDHDLPRGQMWHISEKGVREKIDLSAINHRTGIMSIEGERDDITPLGQCAAIHDLCPNVPLALQNHFCQPAVGHYGVFSGRMWQGPIAREEERHRRKIEERKLVVA